MATEMVTQKEMEKAVGLELVAVLEDIFALKEAVQGNDTGRADALRSKIKGSAGKIHDLMVLADKLETIAKRIRGSVEYAALNTLKDEDLLESGIDGIKVQAGAKRYVYNGGDKYAFLSEVSKETGVVPEYLMEACSFTLKEISAKVGMTQDAFLERFGGFEFKRNAPTVKRTW